MAGPIIEVKTGANKTMEQLGKIQEKKKVDFAKIPLPSPLVLGNPRAAQRIGGLTLCPSTNWRGDWWTPQDAEKAKWEWGFSLAGAEAGSWKPEAEN